MKSKNKTMRAIYIILFIGSFIFSSCLKTDEFEVSSEDLRENAVKLNNPIRFDQLAVGQKSTYVLISPDSCHMPICCQQKSITRQVEIIKQDTNGYLIKETTNSNNSTPLFFYLKYELRKVLRDTLENEPSLKEYDELLAIKTVAIDEDNYYRSAIYGRIGAKFYLKNHSFQKK